MPSSSRNGTKPTYPDLLRGQIIPFNPNNPPAAFPSVSLTTTQSLEPVANLSEISSEVSFTQRPLSAHDLDMSFSTTIDTDSTQPPQTQEENEVSNIDGATTSDRDRMDLDDLTSPAVSTEASKPMMTEATNADSKVSSWCAPINTNRRLIYCRNQVPQGGALFPCLCSTTSTQPCRDVTLPNP